MAYTVTNYLTKKALREAIASPTPPRIRWGVSLVSDPAEAPDYTGVAFLEGPHYPRPHTWYAKVQVTNGRITRILS